MCELIIGKLKYAGSYQDDGFAIFDKQTKEQQMVAWLCNFQFLVNEVVGGAYFQFTAKVWKPLEAFEGIPPEEWEKWKEK
eukprot:6349964-Ditylum_brightwellii.AAC.1